MPGATSYWNRNLQARLSRRRALAGAAAVGGLAILTATGCSGDGGEVSNAEPSILTRPVDTSKQAKRDGVYKHFYDSEITTLDPIPVGRSSPIRNRIYQKLVMAKPGYLEPRKVGALEADAAEAWEISSDKLQITLKLRPNNHFDPRSPTSGRVLEAKDVLFTFQRVEKLSNRRTDLFQSVNPNAPITSVAAPDARTFIIKLGYPDAGLMANLASVNSGFFNLLPVEIENIDIRTDTRGSGPWYINKYTPSVSIEYLRNPGYFHKEWPYIEKIDSPIVTEYASRLAQFRAGNIYFMPVLSQDIVATKRDVPALSLFQSDTVGASSFRTMWGWRPGPKTPFRDERVRQAFSMAQDRDLFIEAIYNVSRFTNEGFPVETRWNSAVRAAHDGWWLDPQGKDFGPNAKYYKYDLAEAKKLLAAAGFSEGIDSPAHYVTTGEYGQDFPRHVEVVMAMVRDAGLRLVTTPAAFLTEWTQVYYLGQGNFDDMAFHFPTAGADPGNELYAYYNTKGGNFTGFDADGRGTFGGDPILEDLTTKIRQEFEPEKRWTMAQELQRHEAKKQYFPPFPGGAGGFSLVWPALANYNVYGGGSTDSTERTWWVDDSKAPIK